MTDVSQDLAHRRFRRIRMVILWTAATVSVLMVLLVLAAWRDDHIISSNMGTATAEVLSAGRLRSAVSFTIPGAGDGAIPIAGNCDPGGGNCNPKLGVLYPTNLTVGQHIAVEYARNDPSLVRVAGRDARVALWPAGSVIAVTWALAFAGLFLLGQVRRRAARQADLDGGDAVPGFPGDAEADHRSFV